MEVFLSLLKAVLGVWPVAFWTLAVWGAWALAGWKGIAVLGALFLLLLAWVLYAFVPAFVLPPHDGSDVADGGEGASSGGAPPPIPG